MRLLMSFVVALVMGAGVASAAPESQQYTNQTPYGTPAAQVVEPPAGYELFFLETVSRHGSRSLTSNAAEKRVLALWEKARKKGRLTRNGKNLKADVLAFQAAERRIGYGGLSTVGVREWTEIGGRVAEAYRPFLEQAQTAGDTIHYVTTPINRTAQSAAAERAAFRAAGLADLDDRSTTSVDPSLVITSGSTAQGRAAIAKVKKRSSVKQASRALLRTIYTKKFVASIKDPVGAAMDVYLLFVTGPGMSADTSVTFARYVPTWVRTPLAQVKDTENFYRYGPGVAGQRNSFAKADPLLRSFFAAIDQRIAGGTTAAVLRHAHGETTMPFAARIRIAGSDRQMSQWVYFRHDRNPWRGSVAGRLAGNIEWAVYRSGDEHLVSVRQNERPARLSGCTLAPDTQWFYTLAELKRCLTP